MVAVGVAVVCVVATVAGVASSSPGVGDVSARPGVPVGERSLARSSGMDDVARRSLVSCTPWTPGAFPLNLNLQRSENLRYGIRVILIDQRRCKLSVRSCLVYKGVGPDGTDYRAEARGTNQVRECVPDPEVGQWKHYFGALPIDVSGQYKLKYVKILSLREVGYSSKDGSDTTVGKCTTTQKFPVEYTKRGVYFIRYSCRV